jgi:hypothetical protein
MRRAASPALSRFPAAPVAPATSAELPITKIFTTASTCVERVIASLAIQYVHVGSGMFNP